MFLIFYHIYYVAEKSGLTLLGPPGPPGSESRMNWLVGGGVVEGAAGVPHYAVDYPLLSSATVKLLSPLLWG